MNRVAALNKESKYRILLWLLRPLRRAADALDGRLFRIECHADEVRRRAARSFSKEA
jgi:hypothetical protein